MKWPLLCAPVLALLSGCGIPLVSDPVPDLSTVTIGVTPPTVGSPPARASNTAQTREVQGDCVPLSTNMLTYLEAVGNAGGEIRFTAGSMIQVSQDYWEAAVKVTVPSRSEQADQRAVRFFRTNVPSHPKTKHSKEIPYSGAAESCVKKL